jgi:mRNA-degrading endonuclease RelE of RelBE toxin-antitoxin system
VMHLYELIYSDTFEKDLKILDPQFKLRLKRLIDKLMKDPKRFKPLHGHSNIFRIRFEQFRLVYKVEENKIILLFLRKRDVVYRNV